MNRSLENLTKQIDDLEERQAILFKLPDLGIWEWNLETNKLNWDNKMMEIFEVAPEDFKGTYEDFESMVNPEDLQKMKETIYSSIRDKLAYEYTFRIKTPQKWKRVKGWGRTLFDEQDKPLTMIGVCMAI